VISEDLYRPLGESGFRVSPLGIGTNKWAQGTNDEAVSTVFEALLDTGVNFFDTAEIYQSGASESLLGACLARAPRKVVVASKFHPEPDRVSFPQFTSALDGSLNRLGLQTLDLYYIHRPPAAVTIETTMDWMAEAVREGKVRAVGVSNFSADQMRQAVRRLSFHGIPLAANQVEYSLFVREPETNGVFEACRELNVALVAYRPLGRGQLVSKAGATRSRGQAEAGSRSSPGRAAAREGAPMEILREIAQKREKTVSQVALNWLLAKDQRVIPIPGTTNARHARENLGALGWNLADAEFASVDEAFPT
jgi:aryl-alcohol dehydrogenase-like predicted oxidoreductase